MVRITRYLVHVIVFLETSVLFLQKELFVIRQAAHGGGSVVFAWDNAGKYLATVGSNRRVHIYRRNGDLFDEFALQEDGPVEQLEWDKDGEVLAVLQPLGQNVTLYEVAVKKASPLCFNCARLAT